MGSATFPAHLLALAGREVIEQAELRLSNLVSGGASVSIILTAYHSLVGLTKGQIALDTHEADETAAHLHVK